MSLEVGTISLELVCIVLISLLVLLLIGVIVLLIKRDKLIKENIALTSDKQHLTERLEFLAKDKEGDILRFKAISTEIINSQISVFDDNQKKSLDMLLAPFKQDINDFRQKIENVHKDNITAKASFDEQFKNLMAMNKTLSGDAQNLTEALKGRKKLQGDWGEFQLERILELSGLEEHISYQKQVNLKDDNNHNLRPDVIVFMPNERNIIIDSKVSLNDYLAYIAAPDEASKKQHLASYIKRIKAHIDELSDKDYQKYVSIGNSLDYVIMFVPVESAYIEALNTDKNILLYASERKIALATPSSLMVMLQIVESMWRTDKQNKSVQEVIHVGSLLYEKIVGFVGDMQKISANLDRATSSYEEAMKKLNTGKGNVLKLASRLCELGIKTSKKIPVDFEDSGELDSLPSDKVNDTEQTNK